MLAAPPANAGLAALGTGPLIVVAAGKAAWPTAAAFAVRCSNPIVAAMIAGPRVGADTLPGFEWFAAGHPDPNAESVAAGRRAMELARMVHGDRTLVVLLSGGASALLALPAAGLTLAEKMATTRTVMEAGIAIDGLNCVRKHLSAIKGGRLGAAAGRVVTLAISDVHGPVPDDPSVIGSGPTVADPSTYADALGIVRAVVGDTGLLQQDPTSVPEAALAHLERGARGLERGDDQAGGSAARAGRMARDRQSGYGGGRRASCGRAPGLRGRRVAGRNDRRSARRRGRVLRCGHAVGVARGAGRCACWRRVRRPSG